MRKNLPFDTSLQFWQALSFTLGFSLAFFAFAFCLALVGNGKTTSFISELKQWQTLITGLVALGIGVRTISAIRDQILLSQSQEDDRVSHKLYAARTALPAALSELSEYGTSCSRLLKNYDDNVSGCDVVRAAHWEAPAFREMPAEALSTLRVCIEHEVNLETRDSLAWLLRRIQIIVSRQNSLRDGLSNISGLIITRDMIKRRYADQVEFLLRVDRCYDYAREFSEKIDTIITAGQLASKSIFLEGNTSFGEDEMKRFFDDIEAKRKSGSFV